MNKCKEGGYQLDVLLAKPFLSNAFLMLLVLIGLSFSTGFAVGTNGESTSGVKRTSERPKPIVIENLRPVTVNNSSRPGLKRHNPPPPLEPGMSSRTDIAPPGDIGRSPQEFSLRKQTLPNSIRKQHRTGQIFLQVLACNRPDAKLASRKLAGNGFNTTIAPGPSSAVVRVLVGPLNSVEAAENNRVRLDEAGFKNVFVRKY